MINYYAGIGSRETPHEICSKMSELAFHLQKAGFVLRSGGAGGADSAFEKTAGDKKEIFLPWDGFNGRKVDNKNFFLSLPEAKGIAASHHPHWENCGPASRKFHTRNVHQILGKDLLVPSKFVICWTKDGKASGGTGQAMRIAKAYKIPVFNLKTMSITDIGKEILRMVERNKKIKEAENEAVG